MEDGVDDKLRSAIGDIREKGPLPLGTGFAVLENPVLKVLVAIADAVNPVEVHEALVDRVGEAVGASSIGLWLVDSPGDTITLVRSRGYAETAAQAMRHLALDTAAPMPVLDSIRSGHPLWIPSQAALYDGYPHLRALATPGRSYRVSCLPLEAHGRVLGALALTIEAAGHATTEEKEFLLLVARYATQAIERLRLYERTEPYRPGARHRSWQKAKCQLRQEFVLGGWQPSVTGGLGSMMVSRLASRPDDGLGHGQKLDGPPRWQADPKSTTKQASAVCR